MYNDYLSIADNIKSFYLYKLITDNKKIIFESNSTNFIKLKQIGKYSFNLSHSFKNNVFITEEDKTRVGLFDSFQASTSENINLDDGAFYLLSETEITKNEDLEKCFYFENKITENLFNEIASDNIQEYSLSKLTTLKEFQNISFVLYDNTNIIQNMSITLERNSLLNNLTFIAKKTTGEIYKAKPIPNTSNEKPFLFFFNPINIQNNTHLIYLWSMNPSFNIPYEYLANSIKVESGRYKIDLEKLFIHLRIMEFLPTFEKIFEIKDVVESGFQGYNEEEIKKWKEDNGNFSKIEDYINYKIWSFLKDNNLTDKQKQAIKSIVLLCSSQLSGSYTFKGGRTEEHKIAFPFFIEKETSGFYLKSLYYNIENNKITSNLQNTYLNHNTVEINDQATQIPLLPDQISEQDFSSNPIDFNSSTYNFNYPFWVFISEQAKRDVLNFNFQTFDRTATMSKSYNIEDERNLPTHLKEARERNNSKSRFQEAFESNNPEAFKSLDPDLYQKIKSGEWSFLANTYSEDKNWYITGSQPMDDYSGGVDSLWSLTRHITFKIINNEPIEERTVVGQRTSLILYNRDELKNFTTLAENNEVNLNYTFNMSNTLEKITRLEFSSLWMPFVKLAFNGRNYTIKTANFDNQLTTKTKIVFW